MFVPTVLAATVGLASAASASPGSLDPTFGDGGIVITNGDGFLAGDAILQPNGDILVSVGGGTSPGVLRYLPNGSLDPSFGTGGFAPISSSTVTAGADGLALQSNGKILVASGATNSSDTQQGLDVARLNPNGALDTTFGAGGIEFVPLAAGEVSDDAVLVESGGDILTGGSNSVDLGRGHVVNTGVVVRLTSSGSPDATFGSGGIVSSATLAGLQTLAVDSAGDVFSAPDSVELSPNGVIDRSVTPAPIAASSQGGSNTFLSNGETLRSEAISAGRSDDEVEIARFLATGGLDSSFTSPEFHYVANQAAEDSGNAIAIAPNGDIVVGGDHFRDGMSTFGLARLTATGALDTAFGAGGVLTTDIQGGDDVDALVVQPNNDIIAVGSTLNNSTGVDGVALVRYLG